MKKKIILISILFAVLVLYGFYNTTNAQIGSCTLNAVSWNKSTVGIGESIILTVGGIDCLGENVTLKYYEEDDSPFDFRDDLIRTEVITFNLNPNSVVHTTSFTVAEYTTGGDESDNEDIYVEASLGAQSLESSRVILNAPSGDSCNLGSASWRKPFSDEPIIGSTIEMIVIGSGCQNVSFQVVVFERDLIADDVVQGLNMTFNSAGDKAVQNWVIPPRGPIGNSEYYFEATLGSQTIQSADFNSPSGVPAGSKSGCVNCNAGPLAAPAVCECADGYQEGRGTLASCNPVCIDHVGDSLGGPTITPTPTLTPAPTSTNIGGGDSYSYNFNIPNPLGPGNNTLIGLINAIADWIITLAIPVVVIMIIYSGIMFVTAKGDPAKVTKAKDILKWALVGLAIILIGKGFITLIESILQLGAGSGGGPLPPGGGLPTVP
jgi:hypothetical protein